MFAGAVAYADDIAILAPTRTSLEQMLHIAETVGKKLFIKFNASKFQFLVYGRRNSNIPLTVGGVPVPVADEAIHLGHYLGHDYRIAVKNSAADLTKRTNILLTRFGHCSRQVKYRLFKAHCMAAYGSNLWDFNQVEPFLCAWRKCVRRLLRLPCRSHSVLLPGLVGDRSPEEQLDGRLVKFVWACSSSRNGLVKRCIQEALLGSRSPVSSSITLLCGRYDLQRWAWPEVLHCPRRAPDRAVSMLKDFMDLREATGDRDIDFIIEHLATS